MFKMKLLPHWCLTDIRPAFYDTESVTAIGQTAKLYGAMNKLIESYNAWIDEVNKTITEFNNETDQDIECFKSAITELCNNYIATMDMKIEHQDRQIEETILYMKENIYTTVKTIIDEMKESGELDEAILASFETVNQKVTELESMLTSEVEKIFSLQQDNITNKQEIATNKQNIEALKDKVNTLYFDNVAAMKNSTKLNSGDTVQTLGYYEVNDGGGATYKVRDQKATDVDDSGSIHFLSKGLVAELIIETFITPEQFGAKGDGETDDTVSINKTITFAKITGLPIFLRKFYVITSPINYDFNLRMEGIYNRSGFIQKNPNADILVFDRPYNVDVKGIQINNIKLIYETPGVENTSAMRFLQSSATKDGWGYHESEFSNIRIDGAYVGIMNEQSEPSWNVKFKNIRLDSICYQAVNINANFGIDMEFIVNGENKSSYTRGVCLVLNCSGIVRNLDVEDWNNVILYVADAYDSLRIEQVHLERCSLNSNYKGLFRIENQYVSIGTIRLYNCQFGTDINGWASVITYHYISNSNSKLNVESISLINCEKLGVGVIHGIYVGRISGEANPQCISLFCANGGAIINEVNMIGGIKTDKVFFNLTPLA